MEYFKESEFACKCGRCGKGFAHMQDALLIRLANARELAEFYKQPFILTSAFRCHRWNNIVGGAPNSSHLSGSAVDIQTIDLQERFIILSCLIKAGFKRIGIGKNFIHTDTDIWKSQGAVWLYDN